MVTDDTIGLHTIDEGLDIGEIICDTINISEDMSEYGYIGVMSTYIPGRAMGQWGSAYGDLVNRSILASCLFLFNIDSDLDDYRSFLSRANRDGKIGDIHNIFFIPFQAVDLSTTYQITFADVDESTQTAYTRHAIRLPDTYDAFTDEIRISKPLTFNNFTPKNNKLKCYPYNYIVVSNNNGEENVLKIENFDGNLLTFSNEFAITIGGSGRLVPLNYRGIDKDIDNSVSLGKLPTFEFPVDSYTNWLTEQSVNNKLNANEMTFNSIVSTLKGNPVERCFIFCKSNY